MLRFQYLTIPHPEEELVALLRKMKEATKGAFLYQKSLAAEYAKNLFKKEDYVGCFKTRRTSLSESSVWVVITGEELRVTNITPTAVASLGITEYNLILNAFFHDFVAKFIDESWDGCVSISGERVSLSDILSENTYRALTIWEASCNKETPISHPMDQKNWMDFVISLQKIMAVTEIFPSSLVGALHKPSGSAVSNRNLLDNNLRWFESARHLKEKGMQ